MAAVSQVLLLLSVALGCLAGPPTPGKPVGISSRIMGGNDIEINTVPYMVSVQLYGEHRCGGFLVDMQHVVTAKHCVGKNPIAEFKVRAGSTYNDQGGVLVGVSAAASHPTVDVAVLKLASALTYSHNIRSLPMAETTDVIADGIQAFVAGWGLTGPAMAPREILQGVWLPITRCKNPTSTTLCAGFPEGGKDTCSKDSGGALAFGYKAWGVVSEGDTVCGLPNSPGIYVKVAAVRTWIDEQLRAMS